MVCGGLGSTLEVLIAVILEGVFSDCLSPKMDDRHEAAHCDELTNQRAAKLQRTWLLNTEPN